MEFLSQKTFCSFVTSQTTFDRKYYFWIEPSVVFMRKMIYKSIATLHRARKIMEIT